jgi:hypothetical protein
LGYVLRASVLSGASSVSHISTGIPDATWQQKDFSSRGLGSEGHDFIQGREQISAFLWRILIPPLALYVQLRHGGIRVDGYYMYCIARFLYQLEPEAMVWKSCLAQPLSQITARVN